MRGARERARVAKDAAQTAYGVGLEGGVELREDGSVWLIGIAAVWDRRDTLFWAEGPKMELPPRLYAPLAEGQELGPLVDDLSGLTDSKSGIGAIGWFTGGLVPRERLWVVTLACAVGPLFRPEAYLETDPLARREPQNLSPRSPNLGEPRGS